MRNKIKRYVSILCLLSLFIGLIKPMNKVEAVTPDAPNLKTIKNLKKGDTILFDDKEWIVLDPTKGKIMTRFSIPDLNVNTGGVTELSYSEIGSYLNTTFLNNLDANERLLIQENPTWIRTYYTSDDYWFGYDRYDNRLYYISLNNIESSFFAKLNFENTVNIPSNYKVFLPSINDMANGKYTEGLYINTTIRALMTRNDIYDISGLQTITTDMIKNEYGGTTNKPYEFLLYDTRTLFTRRSTEVYYFNKLSETSKIKLGSIRPTLFLKLDTQVFLNKYGDGVVLGGKYKFNSPKGKTNKWYFYDRYYMYPDLQANIYKDSYGSIVNISRYKRDEDCSEDYTTLFHNIEMEETKIKCIDKDFSGGWSPGYYAYKPTKDNRFAVSIYRINGWDEDDKYHDSYSYSYATRLLQGVNNLAKKDVFAGSYFLGKDNQYPINGPHSDGYWYVRREEANIEGLGEVDIDNLSLELKKDIMPVLNVVVNKNFDEVVQGRGYIANLTKFSDSKGNFTIYRQNSDYIRINGIFYTKGIYYIPVTDSNGKQVHFLFNVIDDPVPASAKKITFK